MTTTTAVAVVMVVVVVVAVAVAAVDLVKTELQTHKAALKSCIGATLSLFVIKVAQAHRRRWTHGR